MKKLSQSNRRLEMIQVNGGIGSSIHQANANNLSGSGGGSMGNMNQGLGH